MQLYEQDPRRTSVCAPPVFEAGGLESLEAWPRLYFSLPFRPPETEAKLPFLQICGAFNSFRGGGGASLQFRPAP